MLLTLSKTASLSSFSAMTALVAVLGSGPSLAQTQDIVVGQVAPLSGVLADTGREMVLGGQIYFDYINAKGGIKGRRIKHVVKDDAYQVEKTVVLTQELLDKDNAVAFKDRRTSALFVQHVAPRSTIRNGNFDPTRPSLHLEL